MKRALFLVLIPVVILIPLWMIFRGGEATDAATAKPAPAVEEPDKHDPLAGEAAEPIPRVAVDSAAEPEAEASAAEDQKSPDAAEESATGARSNARIWLVGRAVDDAGDPVAERELPTRFQVHQGMFGPTHFTATVTTDEDGRFRQDVDDAWLEAGTPMTLELVDPEAPVGDTGYRGPSYTRDPTPRAARAIFIVPNHLDPGEHDLGEAKVRGAVVLARGRAIDRNSDAVAEADVSLRWAQRVTVPPGADPERFMSEIWWMLDDVGARSSESGAFELVGFAPDAPLRLEAKKDGYLDAESVECEIGATDVEVVLHEGGVIAGQVLFDEGIPRDRFQVEVQVGEGMPGFRRLPLNSDGSFEAEGLPPGLGVVSLVLKPDRDTLVEVDEVSSNASYRDSRLDPLDLRGALTMATVTVVGADGALLDTAEGRVVGLHFPDTSSRAYQPRENPGVLSFLGLGDGLDVQVWAVGYRAKVLSGLRGEVEVQLEPGTTVRAELQSTPLLEEGESLKVMLEIEDEYWRQVAETTVEPGGPAELIASHDGRHQFSLWLVVTTEEGHAGSIRIQSPEAAPAFEVVQGKEPGVQTIVLTDEALVAARESWNRFR